MGNRVSRVFKASKSEASGSLRSRSHAKYPLFFERQMLKQIKKDYDTSQAPEVDESGHVDFESLAITDHKTLSSKDGQAYAFEKTMIDYVARNLECCTIQDSNQEHGSSSDLCDNEDEADRPFNFIDFPTLVVQKLLTFTSPASVLALRQTCRTTKGWIDANGHVLNEFEMQIEPEVCNINHDPPYTSPWSNFSIPFEKLNTLFIEKTIDNFSDIIWSLEIVRPKFENQSPNHPRRMFEIIGKLVKLERLKICRIDSLTELPSLTDCFQCLRSLSIDRIRWMTISDFLFFENLIMKCPCLEYLKIPDYEILGSLSFLFYHQESPPEREYLIRPVITYLDHYRKNWQAKNLSRLYIDVVALEDFKLCSSDVFYELSRKCMNSNAVLMNVYFVPRDAVLREEENIVESFASMFGFIKIDFPAELWKSLETMEIWIEEFENDWDITLRQFEFLKTVSKMKTLNSLTIRMSVENPDICSQALDSFIGQNCETLRKLVLRRHAPVPNLFMRMPVEFGKAFVNLASLYMQEIDCKNEDFAHLWPDLPLLVELFVYKCPYVTQQAFIGESDQECDPIPMLSLKSLKLLVIYLNNGVGGFDDQFLVKGLRFMKLKGFALRGAAGVVFTSAGMTALLDSPFHETIEDFEAPSSCFRPGSTMEYWQFYIALPNKKERRKNHVWLSCTLLMSSLSSKKQCYDFKTNCLEI